MLPLRQSDITVRGHAIEVRLYAEDPRHDHRPSPGELFEYRLTEGDGLRFEDGVRAPTEITPFYDPMMAKIVAWAPTRTEAAARLSRTLDGARVHGVRTNKGMLAAVLRDPDFLAGRTYTDFVDLHPQLLIGDVPRDATVHLAAAIATGVVSRRSSDQVTGFADAGFRTLTVPTRNPAVWLDQDGKDWAVRYRLGRSGEHRSIELELAGETLTMDLVGLTHDSVRVFHRGLSTALTVATYPDGTVWVNDRVSQSVWTPAERFPESGRASGAAGGATVSQLPGTVTLLGVGPGDRVEEGQVLVVIEAMKMEHEMKAPVSGVIESVHVSVGEFVDAGRVLVTVGAEEVQA